MSIKDFKIAASLNTKNLLTSLGQLNKAESTDDLQITTINSYTELETLFLEPFLGRLCTAEAEELQDSTIVVNIPEIYNYISKTQIDSFLKMALDAYTLDNIFGGCLIVSPRVDESLPSVNYILVDPSRAVNISPYNYNEYSIFNDYNFNLTIKKENFFKLDGRFLSPRLRDYNRGWGRSLIEIALQKVTQYSSNNNAITMLLRRLNTLVYGMSELGEILATEKISGELLGNLEEVFSILELYNILVIDKDLISATYANRSLSGIGELIEQARTDIEFIAMATINMPSILLWGKAGTSGLADKGSSELDIWYKSCNNVLQKKVLPSVRWMILNSLDIKTREKFNNLTLTSTQLQEYQQLEHAQLEKTIEESMQLKQSRLLELLDKGILSEKEVKEKLGLSNAVAAKKLPSKIEYIDIITDDYELIDDNILVDDLTAVEEW